MFEKWITRGYDRVRLESSAPSKSAGLRGTWRKLRDRREPLLTSIAGGWRGGCADPAETG